MADRYKFQISGGIMNGEEIERALPEVIAEKYGYDFEEYWHRLEVAAAVSQTLEADVLDNARAILVIGGEGVTVTFGSTGTDALPANPFLFVADEEAGTGYDQITVTNNGSREQKVTIIACSYKT